MSFMATGGGFGGEKCPGEYEHHEYGDATDQSDFDESRGASNVPVTVKIPAMYIFGSCYLLAHCIYAYVVSAIGKSAESDEREGHQATIS